MKRTRATAMVTVVGAVVLVAAVLVGVRLAASDPEDGDPAANPAPSPSASASSSASPAAEDVDVPAYFVGATVPGDRLYLSQRRYSATGTGTDARLQAAVDGAVSGDSGSEDRTSAFPNGTRAQVERTGDGDVSVDLTSPGDLTDDAEPETGTLALQSVVWTVDAVLEQDVDVAFTVDGSPVETILGAEAADPVAKGDPLETLALVSIEGPGGLDPVASPFTVTGQAAANEAALTWRLVGGGKEVTGTTTTRECCTLSPYSFEVSADPGRYTLTVQDTDDSGEGRTNSDTRTVIVR